MSDDEGALKCQVCFRRVREYEVEIMEGVVLRAEIHLTWSGKVEWAGKLNAVCRDNETVLVDSRHTMD